MKFYRAFLYICILLCYSMVQSYNVSKTPRLAKNHYNKDYQKEVTHENTTDYMDGINITDRIPVTMTPSHIWLERNNTANSIFKPTSTVTRTAKKEVFGGQAFLASVMTFYVAVIITGVIGNSLVLKTVTSKRMRSVKNLLIGNLAIADLTILLVCVPVTLTTLLGPWPFGTFICRYVFPLSDVVVSVSVVTLCVITLDRFRAIVYPFANKMSQKTTIIVTVVIWVVSYVVVAVPITKLMHVRHYRNGPQCRVEYPSSTYRKAYRLVLFTTLYVIPVSLVFFCFVCIGRKIRENMRFTRESVRDSRSLAKIRRRSRIAKIMFVIFISFTVCLLPINLLLLLTTFYRPIIGLAYIQILYHVFILILVANSCMNPIILYILSSEFKRSFKEACICVTLYKHLKERRNLTGEHAEKVEITKKSAFIAKLDGPEQSKNGRTRKILLSDGDDDVLSASLLKDKEKNDAKHNGASSSASD